MGGGGCYYMSTAGVGEKATLTLHDSGTQGGSRIPACVRRKHEPGDACTRHPACMPARQAGDSHANRRRNSDRAAQCTFCGLHNTRPAPEAGSDRHVCSC